MDTAGLAFFLHLRSKRQPNGCVRYTGATNSDGYGVFHLSRGKQVRAHRVAWEIANGSIPAGMCVCHTCDFRACINPSHLFLGTVGDNNRDARRKGRALGPPRRRGAAHHFAMPLETAAEIRRLHALGTNLHAISRAVGIGRHSIRNVIYRRGRWASE